MKKVTVLVIILCLVFTQIVNAAPAAALTLTDIKGHWAEREILELISKGVINGNPDGTFKPAALVTRAEFLKMLVTAMGYSQYSGSFYQDTEGHWADIYIDTAVTEGLLTSYLTGERFLPDAQMLRYDIPEIICRALILEGSNASNPYADQHPINSYAIKLYEEYIMRGAVENGKRYFKPNSMVTKAEAATIINRVIKYKSNPAAFIEEQKQLEKIQAGASAARDIEFENFINSPEAEQYVATRFITSGDGVILFNATPEYADEYGQNYRVSNANFKKINEITYNVTKELVKSAKANNHYVKVRYNQTDKLIRIGYYESKRQGEAPAGSPLFMIVLHENPAASQFNTNKTKQPEYITWRLTILYPHISDQYEAGMTLEDAIKDKFRTPEMTNLVNRLFMTVYGSADGSKLYSKAINEYDALRLSLADKDIKNNYSKEEYTYINGIEVYNSNLLGSLLMTTSMKGEK